MNRCFSSLMLVALGVCGCGDDDELPRVARALGPFVGSDFTIYHLDGSLEPVSEGKTSGGKFAAAGALRTHMQDIRAGDLYLIEVTGGDTLDSNYDSEADTRRRSEAVTHSLLWGSELQAGNTHVTLLSELAWIYTRTLVGEVEPAGLRRRLDELATWFITADIDGDAAIDARDILAFEPGKHTAQLSFPLSSLSSLVDADGAQLSVMGSYESGQEDDIARAAAGLFGSITPKPDPERYARWSRIAVDVLGHGDVTSANAKLIFEGGGDKVFAFDFVDPVSDRVTLRALPHADSSLIAWRGCAEVSADQSECFVAAGRRAYVTAVFGPKELIVAPDLLDLTRTESTISGTTLEVRVNHADETMVAAMAALAPGQPVVSGNGAGFLRKVVSVQRTSDYRYTLETADIALAEVLQQGTVYFWKQLVEGDVLPADLQSGDQKPGLGGAPTSSLRLVPTGNDANPNLTLQFGDPAVTEGGSQKPEVSGSVQGSVRITASEGLAATVTGQVTLRVGVEAGFSASLADGIQYARFIPEVEIAGRLALSSTGKVTLIGGRLPVGSLRFRPILVTVGPLPVVLTPELTLYAGASGALEASLTMSMESEASARAGFVYNKNAGVNAIRETHSDAHFLRPRVTGELSATASLTGEIELEMYGAAGPSIALESGFKVTASPNIDPGLEESCERTADVVISTLLSGEMVWDVANSALGRMLGLEANQVNPSLKLFDFETPRARWNEDLPCPDRPQMVVEGFDIIETVTPATPEVSGEYVVRNAGDAPLTWSLDYLEDTRTEVTISGEPTLPPGRTATVRVTLSASDLDGVYENFLDFKNESPSTTQLDTEEDAAVRMNIRLTPESELAAPAIEALALVSPTIAGVEWSYGDAATLPLIRGYYLQYTDRQNVWETTRVFQDAGSTRAEIASLLTGRTYWFRVAAYADNQTSPYSAPRELVVGDIPPTGDCRAFFTGAIVADRFIMNATSEVYVEDAYSEYVGAGDYPDNARAFPKSVASTFDGIAVNRGTKVTIFSEPNFQGDKRLEMQGPAIINNMIWMSDPMYSAPAEADWKEPLQSEYPQSVRMWSQEDMHDWSYGSLIVECGYD